MEQVSFLLLSIDSVPGKVIDRQSLRVTGCTGLDNAVIYSNSSRTDTQQIVMSLSSHSSGIRYDHLPSILFVPMADALFDIG